jgi:uncharacterized protein YrrD
MTIEATKLINMAVAAEDTLSKVGIIKQIIVDPENGQLLGFLVSQGLFGGVKALSIIDVQYWDTAGLITKTEENLVDPNEIIRIKNVLDRNIILFDMPAETEDGISLGIIEDFLIETETGSVLKYYLKDILGKSRIISADKVIKIEQKIIFSDNEGFIQENSSINEVSLA